MAAVSTTGAGSPPQISSVDAAMRAIAALLNQPDLALTQPDSCRLTSPTRAEPCKLKMEDDGIQGLVCFGPPNSPDVPPPTIFDELSGLLCFTDPIEHQLRQVLARSYSAGRSYHEVRGVVEQKVQSEPCLMN